jgi:hypothetical protein
MKKLDIDQKFLEKIKEIRYKYARLIPEGMQYYYERILNGEDLDLYMQTYALSREDLLRFARVCNIFHIYEQIFDLVELAKGEAELIGEYQEYIEELQEEGEGFIDDIDTSQDEEEMIINGGNINLLIYPSYIDESKQKTLSSRSGKEEQTQKSVANLIEQLCKVNYQELRKKGSIHQSVQTDNKKPCYVNGSAFERLGSGSSTKLYYFRISLSDNNRRDIKKALNIDFDTLYLVTNYGDFKNEGMDEDQYYAAIYGDLKSDKNMKEILLVMDIFEKDFTPETFKKAIDIINNGFKITEELTSIIRNRQL